MKHVVHFILIFSLMLFPVKTVNAEFFANTGLRANEISREELIQIFLFFKKFDTKQGVKITVVLPPPDSYLFRLLATSELHQSASQYYSSIQARIASGTAAPVFAATEAEVLIKVANIPWSIGYYYDSIRVNDGFGVKTLVVR